MEVGVHEIDVGPYMPRISPGPEKYTPSTRIWMQFARDLVLSLDPMNSINTGAYQNMATKHKLWDRPECIVEE